MNDDAEDGQELGSYEITELLGKDGMGEVYRVRDARLKRDVAIKILTEEFVDFSVRPKRWPLSITRTLPEFTRSWNLSKAKRFSFGILVGAVYDRAHPRKLRERARS